ncbi:hypothetical protein ACSNOI_12590 [Actinomadura kijaniata]|uniref:hypothetical protein n=1 Tax=Actinomadura kijaniata TaxID=46161 RepID=UPI003F1B99B5
MSRLLAAGGLVLALMVPAWPGSQEGAVKATAEVIPCWICPPHCPPWCLVESQLPGPDPEVIPWPFI